MGLSWHDRFADIRVMCNMLQMFEEQVRAAYLNEDREALMEAEAEWNKCRATTTSMICEAFTALEQAHAFTIEDLESRLNELRPETRTLKRIDSESAPLRRPAPVSSEAERAASSAVALVVLVFVGAFALIMASTAILRH